MPNDCVRYSESLKRKVVDEMLRGRWRSRKEAAQAYGIAGSGTIRNWMAKYGGTAYQIRKVEVMTIDEESELQRLRRERDQLQQALTHTQVENVLHQAFLKIACDELGVADVETFKKNADLTRLPSPKA